MTKARRLLSILACLALILSAASVCLLSLAPAHDSCDESCTLCAFIAAFGDALHFLLLSTPFLLHIGLSALPKLSRTSLTDTAKRSPIVLKVKLSN